MATIERHYQAVGGPRPEPRGQKPVEVVARPEDATMGEQNRRHGICLACQEYDGVRELCARCRDQECLQKRRRLEKGRCPLDKW
jgi:ribosomal protein L32